MSSEQVVTTARILEALRAEYPRERGWATATEVVSADKKRRADLVAWNTWDGRVHVVEVKMSRGDWNLERSTPGKAGAFAPECDAFWLAAPRHVVDWDQECPTAWGRYAFDSDMEYGRAPGFRLGGHPSHELATAFLRRVSADDTLRDLLAGERAAGRAAGKKEALAEMPAGKYTWKDIKAAEDRGANEAWVKARAKIRKAQGAMS